MNKLQKLWTQFLVWRLSIIVESEKTKPKFGIAVHGLKGRPIYSMVAQALSDILDVFDTKNIFTVLQTRGWLGAVDFSGNILFVIKIKSDMEWGINYISLSCRKEGSSVENVLYSVEMEQENLRRDMQRIFRRIVANAAIELANKPT